MKNETGEFLKIILLCVGAAVVYGVLHDQITARLCIEYFTVAHPLIINSDSPTVQGLVWGFIATWWAGALIGVPLAVVSRTGAGEPWGAARLKKPILFLLLCMAAGALLSGSAGYALANSGQVEINAGFADAIPASHYSRFVAAAWAHNASYLLGFAGGMVLIIHVWLTRCGPALREGLH